MLRDSEYFWLMMVMILKQKKKLPVELGLLCFWLC